MINWKSEGYKVGEEVCIVNRMGFYNPTEKHIVGKVVHSGTKILKVVVPFGENKEKTLVFNGKRSCNGVLFGDYYLVYKTIDEYNKVLDEKEKAENLRDYISKNLNNLSLNALEKIKDVVDSEK